MDESEKRGAIWSELRRMDSCIASVRERLAKLEAASAMNSRLAWCILAAVIASWAHQYLGD